MDARVAFVTGAGRGIGAAIATRLASEGWRVAIAARTADQLHSVAAITGALPLELDVTDAGAVAAAIEQTATSLGPLDLLVNNAGLAGDSGLTGDQDAERWWRVFEVNVLGTFLCARAVLPGMCARGAGRIVNVASNAAFFPVGDQYDGQVGSAYMASKAAVVRLTEALAAETRRSGVTVFAISPGMVKTAMTEPVFTDLWDTPRVWSPPERTAHLVAFLASGALDELSGRYIHAADDDWESMPARVGEIRAGDLHALRLRSGDDR